LEKFVLDWPIFRSSNFFASTIWKEVIVRSLIPCNQNEKCWPGHGDALGSLEYLIDHFFDVGHWPQCAAQQSTFKVDVREEEGEYIVEAELPGIKKDEIHLSVEEQTLTIAINRKEETDREGKGYIHRERRSRSMARSLRLSDAQWDQIKAKLEEGVLQITVAKRVATSGAKNIPIE
jgi:HSP20 family protein